MRGTSPFYDRVSPTTVTRCPRRILSIVLELEPKPKLLRGTIRTMTAELVRWAVTESRYDGYDKWLSMTYEGDDGLDHWRTMIQLLDGQNTTWIVTPSVSEWLASTGGYEELTAGRMWIPGWTPPDSAERFRKGCSRTQRQGWLTLGGPTEIIIGRYLSTEVRCVATGNYGLDLRTLCGNATGVHGGQVAGNVHGPSRFRDCSAVYSRRIAKWFAGMCDEWRRGDCGMFGETASKLSYNFYRRKYATRAVVKHQDREAHRLERAGLFGGRTDVFRYTRRRGPHFHIDCRSLYPSILASERCPVGLSVRLDRPSLAIIADATETSCVMATVTVKTEHDRYPYRLALGGGQKSVETGSRLTSDTPPKSVRTIYPIGTFTTTLTGRELQWAIDDGEIIAVHAAAVYRTSREFQPMMRDCLLRRREAEIRGDGTAAKFWKLLANSFGGRWAARSGGWRTDKRLHPHDAWGEWVQNHPDTGVPSKCRAIGFVPQINEPPSDDPKGAPIIFAWLTSMGRARLYEVMTLAGRNDVIQCDTDGLWLTGSGLEALQEQPGLFGDAPGQLRVDAESRDMEFFTPQHYRIGKEWTLSGYADGYKINPDGTITDYQRRSYYPADTADGPSCTLIDERTTTLESQCDYHRCRLEYGHTIPWRLRHGDASLYSDGGKSTVG